MLGDFLRAFILVFIAELGDKSQFLAMTFATKYKATTVMLGVFIGIFINHCIAVLLGVYMSKIIPVMYLQLISGIVFLFFSIITLMPEKENGIKKQKYKFGAILTISVAFFIGELGDKTQITAMTLATQSSSPLVTIAGTVSAMLLVACLGVFVIKKLKLNISQTFIKILSSIIFFCFAITKLNLILDIIFINKFIVGGILLFVIFIMLFFTGKLIEDRL